MFYRAHLPHGALAVAFLLLKYLVRVLVVEQGMSRQVDRPSGHRRILHSNCEQKYAIPLLALAFSGS
jgi:hypothetical protein